MVSGGAAIDPRVIEDFEAMGLPMIQGYGMSEHAPIIAVNQDRYSKAASVGRPMEGVSVKIVNRDEDGVGEIICKSPSVMLGYYEDEEATSKVLDAGWLKTGDLGYMDEEGFLYITGRKKNVIVTKGGKNIFPEELEALLQENPYVVEAVVLGIRDEKVGNVIITADIYPNYQSLAEEEGLTESSEIYHYFKDQVEEINKSLSPYKAIKRINVRKEEFVKTTTGKIKRYEVEKEATTTETKESGRVSYQEVKAAERRRANEFVRFLNESKDPYVRHKFSRPITDLKDMLESSAKLYGENVAFRQKFSRNEPYKEITYKEALGDVNGLGTALINRGLKGKRVAIVGNTCYQWESSYLAVVNGVGVVVPLDKELSIKELEGLIKEAEVSAIICQSKFVDDLVAISKKDDNQLEFVIDFGDNKKKVNADSNEYLNWDKLIKEGKEEIGQGDRQYLDAEILGDEMSILLFTSGTTGMAKAVMLSHYNIAYDLMSAPTILHVNTWDIFFSVLPVHHTYECTAAFLMPLYKGASIAFCQGLKYLSKNLEEVKPTMLLGVPALFEALYKKIWKGIDANGKGNLLRKILRVNRITTKAKIDISRPFVKEIKKALGGRMRVVISGGAAIRPEILDFFNDIGIIAVQGYGLTECAPMVALNPDRRDLMRNASVGHVLPGMEARIVDATKEGIGEICFKGDNIMLGYYNKPKATAEVLKNGWFHTGDLGYIDKDDFVYITGRKKNVIITKNGENVYPEEIEFLVSQIPIVDEVMVWGDVEGSQDAQSEQSENQGAGHCAAQSKTTNSNTIVATITLDKEVADEKLGPGYSLEDAEKVLWQEIDLINDILPFYKKIKKIHIKEDGFEKTSGKKIKRFVESNK